MSLYRSLRWADSVTVYHRTVAKDANNRTVTTWTRQTAEGCFYGLNQRQTVNGSVLSEHDKRICRIPGSALSSLDRGDIVCKGSIAIDIPQNGSPEKLLTEVEHFTVGITADNRQLPHTAHWYASEA